MNTKGSILRDKGIEPALPELERMLTTTAAKTMRTGGSLRQRFVAARGTRIGAIALSCLAFGGTAMAATGAWNPSIGTGSEPSTLSSTPVPAALTAHLGVLRRGQTAQDRSTEVEASMASGDAPDGVRLDSVRYLAPGTNGEAVILLSGVRTASYETDEEPVCVYRPFTALGHTEADSPCFGLGALLSGHAWAMSTVAGGAGVGESGFAYGLVPDGVATVIAKFGSAPDVAVPVKNNYWELPIGGAELSNAGGSHEMGVQSTAWRDAEGNAVPQRASGS